MDFGLYINDALIDEVLMDSSGTEDEQRGAAEYFFRMKMGYHDVMPVAQEGDTWNIKCMTLRVNKLSKINSFRNSLNHFDQSKRVAGDYSYLITAILYAVNTPDKLTREEMSRIILEEIYIKRDGNKLNLDKL